MRLPLNALFTTVGLSFCLMAAGPAATPRYAVTGHIPAADGGWDYASFDPADNRVFVARSDAITAIDLATGGATQLTTASRAHAVVPIPGTTLLAETDGNTATVRLIDRHSGAEKAKIPVGEKPDAAIYDAQTRNLYVMNAKSGTMSVVDPAKATVTATIQLKPGLEFAAIDGARHLFVNNEDENEMEVVDLTTLKALPAVQLKGCAEPSGLAYSATAHRLIAACSNGVAAIVDPKARKTVALIAIGKGPDAVILDDKRSRALIPAGETGVLDVLKLEKTGKVTSLGHVNTVVSARTGTIDPATGSIFLPSATFAPVKAGEKRPSIVPGSFKLLVVKPS